jgi:isopentenyl phosphate kinase
LLDRGYIPQLYGDVVLDETADFSICSGDQIIAKLAGKIKPNRVIFLTDVDGVYADDPRKSKKSGLASDVTGSMAGKLREIKDIKCEVTICNGLKPGVFLKCLQGENVGTRVRS